MVTETKELQAGRELDELIATEVMGWHLPDNPRLPRGWLKPTNHPTLTEEWVYWLAEEPPRNKFGEVTDAWDLAGDKVFRPSTDIDAAWEVVEKIDLLKHRTLEYIPGEGGWWIDDNHNHAVQVVAPTVPLAICRAALAAVVKA